MDKKKCRSDEKVEGNELTQKKKKDGGSHMESLRSERGAEVCVGILISRRRH